MTRLDKKGKRKTERGRKILSERERETQKIERERKTQELTTQMRPIACKETEGERERERQRETEK